MLTAEVIRECVDRVADWPTDWWSCNHFKRTGYAQIINKTKKKFKKKCIGNKTHCPVTHTLAKRWIQKHKQSVSTEREESITTLQRQTQAQVQVTLQVTVSPQLLNPLPPTPYSTKGHMTSQILLDSKHAAVMIALGHSLCVRCLGLSCVYRLQYAHFVRMYAWHTYTYLCHSPGFMPCLTWY